MSTLILIFGLCMMLVTLAAVVMYVSSVSITNTSAITNTTSSSTSGPTSISSTSAPKLGKNSTYTVVFHGHSFPFTYTYNKLNSYPYFFEKYLRDSYPSVNFKILVTAKPSENSQGGAARFAQDVLSKSPDLILIDYCINDTPLGDAVYWRQMVQSAKTKGAKVILLTSTGTRDNNFKNVDDYLGQVVQRVRNVATQEHVPVADVSAVWPDKAVPQDDFLMPPPDNHANAKGHRLIADVIIQTFKSNIGYFT